MKPRSLIVLFCLTGLAYAQQPGPGKDPGQGQPPRGEHRGPPPEAFEACKGKKDGDVAEMKTRDGDKRKGSCRLVFIPEGGPNR